MDNNAINPIEEQRKEALKHYEEASTAIHHWSSFVENAIKNYNPKDIDNNSKEFIWTDELVIEIIKDLLKGATSGINPNLYLKNMKEILANPVEDKRIEVSCLIHSNPLAEKHELKTKPYDYHFFLSRSIPTEKYEAVKKAIERCLNNEITLDEVVQDYLQTKEPHPHENDYREMVYQRNVQNPYSKGSQSATAYEKGFKECWCHFFNTTLNPITNGQSLQEDGGYEIRCIQKHNKNYWLQKDGLYNSELFGKHQTLEYMLNSGGIINSILRKEDSVTFTVGATNNGKIIEKFFKGWNGMEIHYTDGSASLLMEETCLPQKLTETVTLKASPSNTFTNTPRQMWNKECGIHDEGKSCINNRCEEYNPLDKRHTIK